LAKIGESGPFSRPHDRQPIHERRFRTRMRIRPSFNRFRLDDTHGDNLSSSATQVILKSSTQKGRVDNSIVHLTIGA